MKKNVSGQKWRVFAFNRTTNTPVTGDAANITAKISLDHGAASSITDTNPTETEDGYYLFDLTQAETDADNIAIYPESSTSNVQVIGDRGTFVTTPDNFAELGIESDGDLRQVNTTVSNTDMRGTDSAATAAALATHDGKLDAVDANVDSVLVDTATTIPTQISGLNNISTSQVNAEVDNALADINLDHLLAVADNDDVADGSIIAKLAAKGATPDWSDFDNTTDSQEALADAVSAGADASYNPDSSGGVVGTEGGSYLNAATDDGTRWTATDVGTAASIIAIMQLGSNRHATSVYVNGYMSSGANRVGYFSAWNYTSGAWDLLGSGSSDVEMRNRTSDTDYVFNLGVQYTNPAAPIGEVRIKLEAQTQNNGDVLRIDLLEITGASSGAVSPVAVANAVHNELNQYFHHIPYYTGSVYYVDGVGGDNSNNGFNPENAFSTIAYAKTVAAAGDKVRIKAGTYVESVDLNLQGLELECEWGVVLTGTLTISADYIKAFRMLIAPSSGNAVDLTGNRCILNSCVSTSGVIGYNIDGYQNELINCNAVGYSSIGVDISNYNAILNRCLLQGVGAVRGIYLSNAAADDVFVEDCTTKDNGTACIEIVSGCSHASIVNHKCTGDDAAIVDNGTGTSLRNIQESTYTKVNSVLIENADPTDTIRDSILDDSTRFSGAEIASILEDSGTTIPAQIAALNNISTTEVNAQCDIALADYDPPTDTEMDAALAALQSHGDSNWGAAGANPNVLLAAEIATVTDQTHFTLAIGSDEDDAYNDQAIVIYDDSNSDYPSIRVCTDYIGSTKTVVLDSAPDFTMDDDDSIRVFVTAPGSTAPTVGQIRTEMDSNSTQLAAIVADTNELQTDNIPGLIAALNNVAATDIVSAGAITTLSGAVVNVDTVDVTTTNTDMRGTDSANTTVPDAAGVAGGLIGALNNISSSQVNAEVDTALADIHLDHLLAVDYNPASKPGIATALLNELVENNGSGVSRYTTNALSQAPSGGGGGDATEAKQDTIIANLAIVDTNMDSVLVDTGATLPAQITALNNVSSSDITTACTSSLNTYDAPTRAEATSDKNEVIAQVNANETKIDTLISNLTILSDAALSSYSEITALPADSAGIFEKMGLLFNSVRYEYVGTGTTKTISRSNGAVIGTAPVSESGTAPNITLTVGKYA